MRCRCGEWVCKANSLGAVFIYKNDGRKKVLCAKCAVRKANNAIRRKLRQISEVNYPCNPRFDRIPTG